MKPDVKLHCFVIDNQVIYRRGITQILSSYHDIFQIHEGDDTRCVWSARRFPGIIFLGVSINDKWQRFYLKRIVKKYASVYIILIVDSVDEELLAVLREFPVLGCMLRSSTEADVRNVVFSAINGKQYYTPDVSEAIVHLREKVRRIYEETQLSVEEYLIVKLLCRGFNIEEIAFRMKLTHREVETTLIRVKKMIGERTAQGVVNYVLKNKVITLRSLLCESSYAL